MFLQWGYWRKSPKGEAWIKCITSKYDWHILILLRVNHRIDKNRSESVMKKAWPVIFCTLLSWHNKYNRKQHSKGLKHYGKWKEKWKMATAKAIPLRLNFVDVVCDDSLKHLYVNGKKAGCQFDVRLSYYRGHFL